MSETNPPRLLIKMPPAGQQLLESQPLRLAGAAFRLQPLCPNEAIGRPAAAPGPRWYLAEAGPGAVTTAELWELAHQALTAKGGLSATADVYIEPDLLHPWYYDNPCRGAGLGAAPGDTCVYNCQVADLPQGPGFAWHLGQDFSQLKQARGQVADANLPPVRLGIMDVGFDFSHRAMPEASQLLLNLQRNFVGDGQSPNDASDPYPRGLFKNPGHGTGTIAILAGGRLNGMAPPADTNDYLGGAPLAEVIPVRIATSVILLYTSAFVAGLDYLIAPYQDPSKPGNPLLRPGVVSMSLGGLPSRSWAEVVNRAYEAGICLVTAAGNNFPGSPQSIVYPARFRRVDRKSVV